MPRLRSVCLLALLVLAGCGSSLPAAGTAGLQNLALLSATLPNFKHIFVIVLENKEYDHAIGNQQMPYYNMLAERYGVATNYYGIRHPSLTNYLALTGGDTFGIDRNCTDCTIGQTNLVDQLEAARRSWKAYLESMPTPCFVGDADPYRQKHNPFIYYDSVRNNPARCNKIVPFTQFAADAQSHSLPQFVWITPNMCNAMHDCGPAEGDAWLKKWVPVILGSPEWADGGALFVTFDEGSSDLGCCDNAVGGRVATLVISPLGKRGYQSDVPYTHYSLLRTIETAWRMPLLGNAKCDCTAPMADFFSAP